jgi:hypothetical protein
LSKGMEGEFVPVVLLALAPRLLRSFRVSGTRNRLLFTQEQGERWLMGNRTIVLGALLGLVLSGCTVLLGDREAEAEAHRQIELARTLESSSQLREAAHEYSIVAEQFPNTSAYPNAVRKAAYLYAYPPNPGRNDSVALHWLDAYLSLSLSTQERETGTLLSALVERSRSLRDELARHTDVTDSLTAIIRRQSATLSALVKKSQEMESELQQTASELKKLKEVDVRISKGQRRK